MWLCTVAVLALGPRATADDKKEHHKEGAKNASLERLKKLEGTWVAAGKDGKPTDTVVSVFKVVGAGSAVQESIFPGTGHEMVSMYHLDGKDVVMTHYCAAQNQPRMKLDPKSTKDEFLFKFVGGTNIDPAKDMHMHEGSIKFIDDDKIEWSWQGYEDGKPTDGHKVAVTLLRKKK
jgi:hypothetical protein